MNNTVYYLSPVRMQEVPNTGIRKKVWGQLEAMRSLGYQPVLFYLREDGLVATDGLTDQRVTPLPSGNRLVNQWNYYSYVYEYYEEQLRAADFIYIRYHVPTPAYLKLLKQLYTPQQVPYIFCEVPTYPYMEEFRGWKGKIYAWLDRRYRELAGNYYHSVISFYPADDIFGHQPLVVENAIGDSILRQGAQASAVYPSPVEVTTLRMLGLASNLEPFHGYDRVLAGMRAFYASGNQDFKVNFTIISQGVEFERLQMLVEDYKLNEYVTFLPPMVGKQLYGLLVAMDVGVGTLARYRVNLETDNSLKSREYCAFGVPILLGAKDRSFPPELSFVNYLTNSAKAVDIEALISWIKELREQPEWRKDVTQYAANKLSWQAQMRRIFEAARKENV